MKLFVVMHSYDGPLPIFQNRWDFSWQKSKIYNIAKYISHWMAFLK